MVKLLSLVKCPSCYAIQTKPFKKWKYSNVDVNRFECKYGQLFNSYTKEEKIWTIPKPKKST